MLFRLAPAIILTAVLFAAPAQSQTNGRGNKESLLQRVAACQAELQKLARTSSDPMAVGAVYQQLGRANEDLGLYPQAEAAFDRAIAAVRSLPPSREKAALLGDRGFLHISMRKFSSAERDENEALKLYQQIGDTLGSARSFGDLAALAFRENKPERAIEMARLALPRLSEPDSSAVDKISMRYVLADALCASSRCAEAIPVSQEAVALANRLYGPNAVATGMSRFLLGYVFWKSGNLAEADGWMRSGIQTMKTDLGWGHPGYSEALQRYSEYLREQGQVEEARDAEREMQRLNDSVDVRTLSLQAAR